MRLTSRGQDEQVRKQVRKMVDLERVQYDKKGVEMKVWVINADALYPYMLNYIKRLLNDEYPVPACLRLGSGLCQSFLTAKGLPGDIWALAGGPVGKIKSNRIIERDMALEMCRLIFSRLLRDMTDGPIGIHITKGKNNEQWKLLAWSSSGFRGK